MTLQEGPYQQEIPVLFGEADLAGILYFPRVFHYCHVVMENWFGAATGVPYRDWLTVRDLGFPTVHTEADYERPMPFGSTLEATMTVRAIGKRSVDFRWRFSCDGEHRAEVRSTVVCVAMKAFKSKDLPDELRAALEVHLESQESGEG